MTQDVQSGTKFLREKAEASAARHHREPEPVDLPELSSEHVHKLVHELQVHQIELEMQNEELRRVMADLEESHKHFSLLFHRAPIGYLVLDQVGLIYEVNDTFCRMVGRDRNHLVSTPFAECMASDDRGVFLARYRAFFKNPEGKHLEALFPCGRDSGFHAHLEGAMLSHSLGRPSVNDIPLLLVAVTDITERKWAENKRLQLERQMQETQKLESLGVLAGGIAHDFNNLLTVILGNASLALDELPPHSSPRDCLEAIEHTALRAAELCRQMLAYSGKGRFVIESIQIGTLIGEMVSLLKASVSKKAILNLNLQEPLPTLRGDPSQIRQIVMNLVINASEAIGDHVGTITLSTGLMDRSSEYRAEDFLDEQLVENAYVWLEVADTGCGMDPETQRRIFEPFFTTKFTGRGLGLSAVLGIVRGHQGVLKVHSEPGKGTTFKVLFPAMPQDSKTTLPQQGEARPTAWKGAGTILLVDDEESVRITGNRMLERNGFRVLTAADGREALEIYRARRDEIALVLLDLTMPDLDGEETFHELRRIDPNVRVVMSSGYTESEIIPRFAGQPLAGFLQKPYSTTALMDCLRVPLSEGEP
jgi:PAS domain S-box-containing protein